MTHEAFVRAVEAEQARQRELALLVHRALAQTPPHDPPERRSRPAPLERTPVLSRLAERVGVLFAHRRQPRHLAAADYADRTFV